MTDFGCLPPTIVNLESISAVLKANKNFLELQEQLAEIEDQLQMARRYYNGTVRNLNIAIQSFPSNLLADPLGFRAEPYFELDDRREAAAPGVAFAAPKP